MVQIQWSEEHLTGCRAMVTSGLCHSGTPVHQLTGVFIQWGLISVIAKLLVNGEPQGCDLKYGWPS